jgi:hypothetical protein
MLRYQRLHSVFIIALLLSGAFPANMAAQAPVSAEASPSAPLNGQFVSKRVWAEGQTLAPLASSDTVASLLSSSGSGVVFEVRVPWEQLTLETATVDGVNYVRVSLPGWTTTAQPGAPVLPFVAEPVGVPFGVSVAVRVVPGSAHTRVLSAPILPAATQTVGWEPPTDAHGISPLPLPSYVVKADPAVYATQAAYPQELTEVASDGILRQQRVVGICVYPVQYHPATQKLTVYESLRVEVTFEGDVAAALQAPSAESVWYESLFREELLNYDSASQWRQPLPSSASAALGEGAVNGLGVMAASTPWAPPVPGWRVKVREEGFYKLTYAELLAAGLPVDKLEPQTFRLYNLGSEVAVYVSGEGDGVFDSTDFILFYGQAVASKYTSDNVYWLTYGHGAGLRMAPRSGTPGIAATPAYYGADRHMEQNHLYVSLTPGDDDLERWMWDYIYPPDKPSWTYTFTLAAPYAASAALTMTMLGYVEDPINPDHHARISVNGTQVGDVTWDGITSKTVQAPIPQGLLAVGSNTLSVVCPNDTGVGYDVVFVDWVELQYANTFRAEGDELSFTYGVGGTWKYRVDGFSSNQVVVYDVTNAAAVVPIDDISVASSALGYAVQFQDTVAGASRYWTMATGAYRTVQGIEQDTASDLQSTANGADHIVIYHKDFAAQAGQLRDFRASQGWRAIAVDVQDVYDEFGYGLVAAAAIHDFLAYAYGEWAAPAPSFVVLIGDGHYDPKNYAGYGRVSYMPPYLAYADPWIGETAADNRYVTVAGEDRLPDLMLGRLAVNDGAEASAMVNKIVAYEQSPVAGDWRRQVLAVAEDGDSAGNFAQQSDRLLADDLPAPYVATKVNYGVTHTSVGAAREAILAAINAGKLLVNFIGHAAVNQWADEALFTVADVAGLSNGGKLPVMLAMTCYDGYYDSPDLPDAASDALAEVVTRANGHGAVASWSPTGLGVCTGHDYLDRGFFEARFADARRTLGEATMGGKLKLWTSGSSLDLLDTYLLFGDPALQLGIPADVDADCDVDIVDIMLVASHWNSEAGDPEYDARYDLDRDGDIDIVDIMLVASRWNTHC